uniref:Tetraspanin n=1 Tax=Ciona savignyi TaxID=51511 RepID=H2YPX4_CIOSA
MAENLTHRKTCCCYGQTDDTLYEWIKIFLIVFNFFFLVGSLGFIGLGV